jgi:hypothetical protein
MNHRVTSRRYATDLLVRPPSVESSEPAADLLIDTAAQVRSLADLVEAGLLSSEEFEEAKLRVLRGWC